MNQTHRILLRIILVVAFLGFADSTYLTVQHYLNTIPPCSVVQGCEEVLTSKYATVAGIPVALGGVLYYLAVVFLALWYLVQRPNERPRLLFPLTIVGFLVTLYLVYLQLFVLHAICAYCMGSAISSTLVFVFGLLLFFKARTKTEGSREV